jgi:hypothetical protein
MNLAPRSNASYKHIYNTQNNNYKALWLFYNAFICLTCHIDYSPQLDWNLHTCIQKLKTLEGSGNTHFDALPSPGVNPLEGSPM